MSVDVSQSLPTPCFNSQKQGSEADPIPSSSIHPPAKPASIITMTATERKPTPTMPPLATAKSDSGTCGMSANNSCGVSRQPIKLAQPKERSDKWCVGKYNSKESILGDVLPFSVTNLSDSNRLLRCTSRLGSCGWEIAIVMALLVSSSALSVVCYK